jgi:threonine/homoserine/homoserine lactone efflux protein
MQSGIIVTSGTKPANAESMDALTNFFLSFILSFAGSIPPGTINLTVVQLGLEDRVKVALRFALAASLIEYPYAWIAVKFEKIITSSPVITDNIQIISALVLVALGLVNIWPKKDPSAEKVSKLAKSGYRRGILLGILNPLAIPYWIGITAYLQSQHWVNLGTDMGLHAYLAGVVCGGFLLLVVLAYLSRKVMVGLMQFPWIKKIPGYLLLALGIYSLIEFIVK